MRVRFSNARASKLAKTSATFEHGRWLNQDRLRLRHEHGIDKPGQEPEHEYEQHNINHRPPEEHSEHPLRHPQHEGDHLSGNGYPGTIDALLVLIHDRNGGGYVLYAYAPPT